MTSQPELEFNALNRSAMTLYYIGKTKMYILKCHLILSLSEDVVQPKTFNVGAQATCGGSVQVPVDGQLIIKSPNYPLNYDNNTECTWLITGLPGRRFQMIFEDFLLERG